MKKKRFYGLLELVEEIYMDVAGQSVSIPLKNEKEGIAGMMIMYNDLDKVKALHKKGNKFYVFGEGQ